MDNIHAIDKFVAEATSYRLVEADFFGEKIYVPQFITDVNWSCDREHMVHKWKLATASKDPNAYLIRFYSMLDCTNAALLSNWIIEHGEHQFMV